MTAVTRVYRISVIDDIDVLVINRRISHKFYKGLRKTNGNEKVKIVL